jgi:hypothetical protein
MALAWAMAALLAATILAGGWPGGESPGAPQVARAEGFPQQTPTAPDGPTRPGALWGDGQPPLPTWGEGMEVGPREELLPRTGIIEVLVELDDPPAARAYALARALRLSEAIARAIAAQQAQAIDAAQRALLPSLTAPDLNATIMGRTQHTLNGVLIRVDASKIEAIRRLPGVLAVRRLRIGEYSGQPAPSALPSPGRPVNPAPVMPGQPDGKMTG